MRDDDQHTDEGHETIVDRLLDLFRSDQAAAEYGRDPGGWVEQNLPAATTPDDVAECIGEVTERMGPPFQANAAHYVARHGTGTAATGSVVNEVSYTYNTTYQQNAFILAEEGAQVANIQGDGNVVTQTQIDLDFHVEPVEAPLEEPPADEPVAEEPPEVPFEDW
ncbi:MAG: hypothetical protein AAGK32_05925, partial [Actinomycetota bacterium]